MLRSSASGEFCERADWAIYGCVGITFALWLAEYHGTALRVTEVGFMVAVSG